MKKKGGVFRKEVEYVENKVRDAHISCKPTDFCSLCELTVGQMVPRPVDKNLCERFLGNRLPRRRICSNFRVNNNHLKEFIEKHSIIKN